MSKSIKYSASFTTGSLFLHETEKIVDYLVEQNLENNFEEITRKNILKMNAESSRKRVLREIIKRSKYVDNFVWKLFSEVEQNQKAILLFYVCCKTYQFILDFQIEVILEKFRSFDLVVTNDDVFRFIEKKSIDYNEIDVWSNDRKYKVTRATLLILEQAGLIKNDRLTPLEANNHFWLNFIKLGDPWFLELALLNKQQRDKILELNK